MHQEHREFPLQSPHPSYFHTAPPAPAVEGSSTVSSRFNSPKGSNTTDSSRRRFRRSSSTVELEENKAYHPLGGPEYIKILAKYQLFSSDEHHGRVVCRFVNTGSSRNRRPQVIKVEEHSAQGNQEFLARISVGNPPQSNYPNYCDY
jgi:hypothetical protein